MTLSTSTALGPPPVRAHTFGDLEALGEHYGIDYHFPRSGCAARSSIVLRGRVQELAPAPGLQLVTSDIEVLKRYDSCSRAPTPLSIIVMLAGEAEVGLAGKRLTLRPGMALSVRLDQHCGLTAIQGAGQRIRALTLSLDDTRLAELTGETAQTQESSMHAWRLPGVLQSALEEAVTAPLAGMAQQLQLQGLSLQLLAYSLSDTWRPTPSSSVTGERQRLERVRETLRSNPAHEHRLDTLAQLAAMSPASLRRKYHAAFGRSVFDELRHFRLSLARDYLYRGLSVQQAAHFCGYRHAGNFSTAFRRHYGISPGTLTHHS